MKEQPGRPCDPRLLPLIPVARALGDMLGPDYEIVLHDTSNGGHSIVEICNGALTGRSMDAPLTDFGEFLLDSTAYEGIDHLSNYASEAPDGRPMRSSVAIIRDEGERIIGFLCINYDLTRASMLKDLADFLTAVRPLSGTCGQAEKLQARPEDRLREQLDDAKRSRGGTPLRFASKQERLELLDRLDRDGFFLIKGAMESLSGELGKSPYTLYGDLRTVRGKRSTGS